MKPSNNVILGIIVLLIISVFIYFLFIQTPNHIPWSAIGNPHYVPPIPPHYIPWTPIKRHIPLIPIGPSQPLPPPFSTRKWRIVAQQGGNFAFDAPNVVRYGSDAGIPPHWTQQTLTSGTCTVTTFGGDPNPGTIKTCQAFIYARSIVVNKLRIVAIPTVPQVSVTIYGAEPHVSIPPGVKVKLNFAITSNIAPAFASLLNQKIKEKEFLISMINPTGGLVFDVSQIQELRPFAGIDVGIIGWIQEDA